MLIHQAIESSFHNEKVGGVAVVGENRMKSAVLLNRIPKELWDPLLWGIRNVEAIERAVGEIPCDEPGYKKLTRYLYKEKRYDLFVAAIIHYQLQTGQWDLREAIMEPTQSESAGEEDDGEVQRIVLRGEWHSFSKWCDEEERLILQDSQPGIELMRLGYLACVAGYPALGWEILLCLDSQQIQQIGCEMNPPHIRSELIYKRWVRQFYAKQPEGKQKKRLGKRIVKYGPELSKWPIDWEA